MPKGDVIQGCVRELLLERHAELGVGARRAE